MQVVLLAFNAEKAHHHSSMIRKSYLETVIFKSLLEVEQFVVAIVNTGQII